MALQYSYTSHMFISREKIKDKMTLKIISEDLQAQSKTVKKTARTAMFRYNFLAL